MRLLLIMLVMLAGYYLYGMAYSHSLTWQHKLEVYDGNATNR